MFLLKCFVCNRSWPDRTELCVCGNAVLIPEEISSDYKDAQIKRIENRMERKRKKLYRKNLRENKYF